MDLIAEYGPAGGGPSGEKEQEKTQNRDSPEAEHEGQHGLRVEAAPEVPIRLHLALREGQEEMGEAGAGLPLPGGKNTSYEGSDAPLFTHMTASALAERSADAISLPAGAFEREMYRRADSVAVSSSAGAGSVELAARDERRARKRRARELKLKRKRGQGGEGAGESDEDGDDAGQQRKLMGPWAGYAGEGDLEDVMAKAEEERLGKAEEDAAAGEAGAEDAALDGDYEDLMGRAKRGKSSDSRVGSIGGSVKTRSTFHGDRVFDYQGRSYVRAPPRLVPDRDHECFIPKRKLHTFSGHTDGVAAIDVFPRYGHLLLSASMDMTVRLWSTTDQRRLLRTFFGHSRAVKGAKFSPHDGRRFVSHAYDRLINMWDTETGACIASYTPPGNDMATASCVAFHPQREHENVLMAGCSDRRIYQFDTRSGDVVQTYDEHMGGVNTITWLEHGKKFVSSSDDKTLRLWEFGYPVVVKHISEPEMHSMPAVTHHPREPMYAAQSLDNTILVYSGKERDKYRQIKKMKFRGHNTAGYACKIAFSPDGHYMVSGTAGGGMAFWDWSNQKKVREIEAHRRGTVCIGVEWHPIEPAQVFSCGWDHKIHLFG
jgi:pre-mRNA-processing factor 17